MATPGDSETLSQFLDDPNVAPLRKFSSLGYSVLLRLQSELTAMETHNGEALRARIDLRANGATGVVRRSEASAYDRQVEEELRCKLINYYMLLNVFSKVQSATTPHKIVLEQFHTILRKDLEADIERTTWSEDSDLMNPFTNRLPQRLLITMYIVSFFDKMKNYSWFTAVINKLPALRRRLEHSEWPGDFILSTDGISDWLSELVVIIVPTIIVAPMFALYAIPSIWERMASIWGFAIIFAVMTRLLSNPSSEFILVTNAAFCAVLVVFVGTALPE